MDGENELDQEPELPRACSQLEGENTESTGVENSQHDSQRHSESSEVPMDRLLQSHVLFTAGNNDPDSISGTSNFSKSSSSPSNPEDSYGEPSKIPFFQQEVPTNLVIETQLVVLAFGTGMIDAISFHDYRVFSSNQTGNTALLAVASLQLNKKFLSLPHVAFSLGFFLLGGLIFGQAANYFGRRKRWWLIFSNLVQTSMVFIVAALRHFVEFNADGKMAWAIIILLAFSSGGQVAYARTIDCPEITTAMVTSAYIDVMVDDKLFKRWSRRTKRRVIFVLSLMAGSFLGVAVIKYASTALSILLSAIIRLMSIALFFIT